MEYISGPAFETMPETVPRDQWQDLVDQAVGCVRSYIDWGVLKRAVEPENFIATPRATPGTVYQVFMVNFAKCKFWEPEQSTAEWGALKSRCFEQDNIGRCMRFRLRQHEFDLKYEPEWMWWDYFRWREEPYSWLTPYEGPLGYVGPMASDFEEESVIESTDGEASEESDADSAQHEVTADGVRRQLRGAGRHQLMQESIDELLGGSCRRRKMACRCRQTNGEQSWMEMFASIRAKDGLLRSHRHRYAVTFAGTPFNTDH